MLGEEEAGTGAGEGGGAGEAGGREPVESYSPRGEGGGVEFGLSIDSRAAILLHSDINFCL